MQTETRIHLSRIPGRTCTDPEDIAVTFDELTAMASTEFKGEPPLVSGATFGGQLNTKGHRRHNTNVIAHHAIIVDHDAGTLPIDEARRLLESEGINAILHTTKRHTAAQPRWRAILPLKEPIAPAAYAGAVAAIDRILGGGIAARESSTPAQFFYLGRARGSAAPRIEITRESWHADELLSFADASKPSGANPKTSKQGLAAKDSADIAATLDAIPNGGKPNWHHWIEMGLAVYAACEGAEEGFVLWDAWSRRHPSYDADASQERWSHFRSSPPTQAGMGKLFHFARQHKPSFVLPSREIADAENRFDDDSGGGPRGLRFIPLDDCATEGDRGYVVKGLLAPGDIAAIIGEPGAGKSLAAPAMALAVAQGRDWHGCRVRQGAAFYVAAEDGAGMAQRLRALKEQHGTAPLSLVLGTGDLLAEQSEDMRTIMERVEADRPSLIVIDTVAAAFPGLEENDARAMGQVVAAARRLASFGAAVVLIHHTAKNGVASPRGHSLLNGALDLCIVAERGPDGGDPRLVTLRQTKNRNGPSTGRFAFRIGTRCLGVDADGDAITAAIAIESEAPHVVPRSRPSTLGDRITDLLRSRGRVQQSAFTKEAAVGVGISSAENEADRQRAIRRAITSLIAQGRISVHADDAIEAVEPDADKFEDESGPDNPNGPVRTSPRAGPDQRTGRTHPLGVSGGPVRPGDLVEDQKQRLTRAPPLGNHPSARVLPGPAAERGAQSPNVSLARER